MKNGVDYSQYKCPYEHLEKECGHELKGPEGYEDTYGVWCACGFRGPVFYLNPEDLKLERREVDMKMPRKEGVLRVIQLANMQEPEEFVRDFDATEWSFEWMNRGGVDILRVMHDNTDDYSDSFEFVEFSAPVRVELIAQH